MFAKSAKTIVISTLGAALALAAVATEASAIVAPPSAYYHASACQAVGTSDVRYSSTGLYNAGSTWASAVCPIPNTWSGRIGFASVKAVDQNPSSDFICTMYVLDNTQVGLSGWWETQTTSGAANAVQEMVFGSIGTADSNHFFSMYCWIPGTSPTNARSSLKSYYILEN